MGTSPKRSFATRLPPEQARKLEKEIAQSKKNQSQYLREIIGDYLGRKTEEDESEPVDFTEKMLNDLE